MLSKKICLVLLFLIAGIGGDFYKKEVVLNSKFPIVVYGDSRKGYSHHSALLKLMKQCNPEILIHTGDMVNSGKNLREWKLFDELMKFMEPARLYASLGNHDLGGKVSERIINGEQLVFHLPYKNLDFILIHCLLKDVQKVETLLNSLKSPERIPVLVMHYPIFTAGSHYGEKKSFWLKPLIHKFNIPLVFSGHDHCYERFEEGNTTYIVAGGGGAPLYPQKKEVKNLQKFLLEYHFIGISQNEKNGNWEFNVINLQGKLMDFWELKKGTL